MRAADTNVLVRLIARDDETQLQTAIRNGVDGYWISHVVLAEAIWVLKARYRRRHGELINILESILGQQAMIVQDADLVVSALEYFRANAQIEFSDCLILETAKRAGHLPLATFDRALARLDDVELMA
jgi:predicted nucleic-acid-binding protein